MRIYNFEKENKFYSKTILILGYFGSLHHGHIKLIKKAIDYANKNNCKVFLMTFNKNPLSTILGKEIREIFLLNERLLLIKRLNIDNVWLINFSKKCSLITWQEFNSKIKNQFINIKKIFIGSDFKYGHKAIGDKFTLKKNFDVDISSLKMINQKVKFSTKYIGELFNYDNIEIINKYLFHNYFILGKVIKGKNIGSQLGYPTANFLVKKNKIYPKLGVYFVKVKILSTNKWYFGALCISTNPTIAKNNKISIETYILNYYEFNLYNKFLYVEFIKFIRKIKNYNDLDSLRLAIDKDIKFINQYIAKNKIML